MDSTERRALLAVFLSIVVLFFWQSSFLKKKKIVPTQAPQAQQEQKEGAPPQTHKFQYQAGDDLQKISEEEIKIETDLYSAVFSTHGAALKSWKLKKYKTSVGKSGEPIEMVTYKDPRFYTLGLYFTDPEFQKYQNLPFSILEKNDTEIVFQYRGQGIQIERWYVFNAKEYAFDHTTKIWPRNKKPKGDVLIALSEGFSEAHTGNILTAPYQDARKFVYKTLEDVERENVSSLKEDKAVNLVTIWGGIENRYFLSALLNTSNLKPYLSISSPLPGTGLIALQYPFYLKDENNFLEIKTSGYLGPKKREILEKTGSNLEQAIDFGMFSILCVPLLKTMNFFDRYVKNYGIAIILLTLLIRLLFHPLTKKSLISMRQMQEIQPQMKQLREKLKDDKQKLNQEIMDLMRRNKVNPLGGCLPLLFQMPIFFALYKVLYNAIELYQAPFFGWIQDLSAKDPYYVLPLLMGVAMFGQQKLTPSGTMDPTQQKMMMMMPIVFTFFMIPLPSGLVLYILFSTALQVLSQLSVHRGLAGGSLAKK